MNRTLKKSAPPSHRKRIVITGMSVISTLGDDLATFHANLLRGTSGITAWKDTVPGCFSRIGGDMSAYDLGAKLSSLGGVLPTAVSRRLGRLVRQSPRATGIGMIIAGQAFADAGLFGAEISPERMAAVLAGPYLHDLYKQSNWHAFTSDPDDSDVALALKEMDTDALACIMEVLGINGTCFSTGGACAAGNIALRTAMDEIRHHGSAAALVVSGFHELTPASLHSLARLGALSLDRFDAEPGRASRPFAADRNGFVPATGAAALVIEELTHALGRGARIYAELLGVGINTNGSRDPTPQAEPMAKVMELALEEANVDKSTIDYLCAHATATPLGDLAEARAIEQVFGARTGKLKINALKSMLGHQLGASALVEMVACVLQMRHGVLYPTINIERIDPEIFLDVCPNQCIEYRPHTVMKNAFGFGGVNSAAILRRYD